MSSLWTAGFWKAAVERALKAFSYTLVGLLSGGVMDIIEAPWQASIRIAAHVAVLSLLGSVSSSALTGGGPSLTNAERLPKD